LGGSHAASASASTSAAKTRSRSAWMTRDAESVRDTDRVWQPLNEVTSVRSSADPVVRRAALGKSAAALPPRHSRDLGPCRGRKAPPPPTTRTTARLWSARWVLRSWTGEHETTPARCAQNRVDSVVQNIAGTAGVVTLRRLPNRHDRPCSSWNDPPPAAVDPQARPMRRDRLTPRLDMLRLVSSPTCQDP
jgi:hypothetical protein